MLKVEELRGGHQVDLHGDAWVDPLYEDPVFEKRYQIVNAVVPGTPETTAVRFGNWWIGFPRGHSVAVVETATFDDSVDDGPEMELEGL